MSLPRQGSRFADYFVICGLDVASGLEPDLLSGESLHCTPLDRPYKSKVLASYPDSVAGNPFDKNAVGMLCLPKGLTFRTHRNSRRPKFHSFMITREDGSHMYGSSLVFFEEVTNAQICAAMQTLQNMHQTEVSTTQLNPVLSTPDSGPDKSPRIEKKHREISSRTYDINKDKLYVTKCICLITQMQYVSAPKKFLMQLYEVSSKPSSASLPLESYVYNILFEVPLLPPGRSMKFFGVTSAIFCQRPSANELPLFDFSLWELFRLLGLENVLQVFVSVLLEHQVLLYSADFHRLIVVAEGLSALIFPFSWQHVYVPILPASLQHFLDAPVPFIMGLHHSGHDDRSALTLPSEANMCFVDIDVHKVEVPEDLPTFPYHKELSEELIQVLRNFQDKLHKDCSDSNNSTPKKKSSVSKIGSESSVSKTETWAQLEKMEILQQSEAWAKISALAKKTGVWSSLDDFSEHSPKIMKDAEIKDKDSSCMPQRNVDELKFNCAIRETFFNRFVHMFCSYEEFIIQPTQDMESWLSSRESMQNFDKAAFLSDQPECSLPFLSPFIETQMFATLIDNKILSNWEEADPNLHVFNMRVKKLQDEFVSAAPRTPTYSVCTTVKDAEMLIEKRATFIDHEAIKPHSIEFTFEPAAMEPGAFPILNKEVLYAEPLTVKSKSKDSAKWRRKDRHLQHSEHLKLNSDQREKYMQEARSKHVRQSFLSDIASEGLAQTNWKFVETLLRECKIKTKRMLVEKMGQEAVELGHGEGNITGVEENTLIASLCDLLERIWSHGLQTKKGKSSLWSHLLNFVEIEECNDDSKPVDPNLLSPDLSQTPVNEGEKTQKKSHRRTGSRGNIDLPVLKPLPHSLAYDMRKVQEMTDIRTDVGYARAWVRLALEKKMLSTHLKELLSDSYLLRSLYKRYAFLRFEDEREQFLYHLLSLNAMDYFCFTNTFTNTMVPYRLLIFPSQKFGCGSTSANPWVSFAGQLGETGVIEIPKGLLEICVEHKNLGVLTTLRIGHDNSGITPRWLVDYVLIRNEISGHTFRFTCGRWLGKGVDDGSTERLLVAELLPRNADLDDLSSPSKTPPRCVSPASPKRSSEQGLSIPEIQEMLGHAVNSLIKHFYKPEKERGNLTFLLCGERGLVHCMEHIFQYGFRSSRLFRNKFFIWDYLEKLKSHFESLLEEEGRKALNESAKAGCWLFCSLLDKINNATETVGKDGKFQIFVCIGVRDHTLQKWLPLMAKTTVTAQMYEEKSFLRDRDLLSFIIHILDTLNDFNIGLEASLTRGLDI
ncbi:hypothetical protein CHS0354_027948 [Potamilus streckersoni]|uniref:DENN domain-containing protein 5B n=1 Tax=Potamilus streckersoni TaxID=2493646 RepID=A0AAE0T531_9BIVA|nr:hypothetical protein CHS0354_027948 [Potamilus streckersoni]